MIFNNIKTIALKKGIPIYRLEQEAGLGKGSICKWNSVSPSVKNLKRVADVLGVKLDELIG